MQYKFKTLTVKLNVCGTTKMIMLKQGKCHYSWHEKLLLSTVNYPLSSNRKYFHDTVIVSQQFSRPHNIYYIDIGYIRRFHRVTYVVRRTAHAPANRAASRETMKTQIDNVPSFPFFLSWVWCSALRPFGSLESSAMKKIYLVIVHEVLADAQV